MLLAVRPKRSTVSTASPSAGAGASPCSARHSRRSPVEIRKSMRAAYARGGPGGGSPRRRIRYTQLGRMSETRLNPAEADARLLELVGDVCGLLDIDELR